MIWESCQGQQHVGPIKGVLYRLVESQEQIATLGYVDTLDEQALLEEMLEEAKPPYRDGSTAYHYLLKSPFRYPPLKWGSRFGRTHEPSIFYGGSSISTTLAESAYYRFLFWFSMDTPAKNKVRSAHTLFSVGYHTALGIRLQNAPFCQHISELTHPANYLPCQLLGSAMRAAGVVAFEYRSARDPNAGYCTGLFSPDALSSYQPDTISQWLCELSAEDVSFKQVGVDTHSVVNINISHFLVEGEFPLPT